jgi:hypothetical protein
MAKIVKTITGLKPDQDYLVALKVKNTEISAIDDPYESIRIHTPRDQSIPGAINVNTFYIYGNYKSVMFDFQPTPELDVNGYKYELYSDALGTTLISSGTATATVFAIDVPDNSSAASADAAPTDVIYYGRIKSIDTSGNESGWTPSSGLKASTATDLISGSHIASLTAAKITAGTIGAHEIIMNGINSILKSSNYQPATSNTGGTGWKISGDGKAVFNEASIRSSLDIGEDLGTSDATSFHVDATGNMWSGANSTSYATAPFRVTNTGDVSAKNITLTGNTVMSANSKIYLGTGNYNNTNTPFYVDSANQFSLGNKLTWDGSTLTVSGNINVTGGNVLTLISDVQSDADTAYTTAISAQGIAVSAQSDADYAVTQVSAGAIIATINGASTTIDGDRITTGTLNADRISGGTISASTSFNIRIWSYNPKHQWSFYRRC